MKCTSKIRILSLLISVCLLFCSCGKELSGKYDIYETSKQYGLLEIGDISGDGELLASDMCVTDGADIGIDSIENTVGAGAGVFNIDTKEVLYSQNILEQVYPASTTKVLTAYLALKYGNLDDEYTVSEHACDQRPGSNVCGLNPGDVLSLRQLLHGLLIYSGNDVAVVIAEGISGSEQEFVNLMNEEAKFLGATHSHFLNPHGLHEEDHYTTVYDMYLIFSAALSFGEFQELISTPVYNATYHDKDGATVSKEWENTNRYLTGQSDSPEGFAMIGGKTGTTGSAGYCLVMLSKNPIGQSIVSVVFKAETPYELYEYMSELLTTFAR